MSDRRVYFAPAGVPISDWPKWIDLGTQVQNFAFALPEFAETAENTGRVFEEFAHEWTMNLTYVNSDGLRLLIYGDGRLPKKRRKHRHTLRTNVAKQQRDHDRNSQRAEQGIYA